MFTRSSKRPALRLLEVCWTFAGLCKHPIIRLLIARVQNQTHSKKTQHENSFNTNLNRKLRAAVLCSLSGVFTKRNTCNVRNATDVTQQTQLTERTQRPLLALHLDRCISYVSCVVCCVGSTFCIYCVCCAFPCIRCVRFVRCVEWKPRVIAAITTAAQKHSKSANQV